jgi:hypothetical protein
MGVAVRTAGVVRPSRPARLLHIRGEASAAALEEEHERFGAPHAPAIAPAAYEPQRRDHLPVGGVVPRNVALTSTHAGYNTPTWCCSLVLV